MPPFLEEKFVPPESAKNNAKKVLAWKEKYGDEVKGMTSVGWTRASQLASGKAVSADIVKRMAQFNRHRKNSSIDPKYKDTPWKDAGYVAWLGWGGDSGIDWAMEKSKNLEESFFYFSEIIPSSDFSEAEVEILRAGKIHDRGLEITMDMLEDFVKNFKDNVYGQEIPVNAEHKRGSEAMGWFKDLYLKGKSLMGKIEWTKLGAEKIKGKIFKFISAELGTAPHHLTGKTVKNVLVGAGLTNIPAMKDQQALTAFSEEAKKYFLTINLMEKLKEKFDSLMESENLSEEAVADFAKEVEENFAEESEAKVMLAEMKAKCAAQEVAKTKEEMEAMKKKMKDQKMAEESDVKKLSEALEEEKAARIKLQEEVKLSKFTEEIKKDMCLSEERGTGFKSDEKTVSKVANFMLGLTQEQKEEFVSIFKEVQTVDLSEKGADAKPGAKANAKLQQANAEALKRFKEDNSKPLHEYLSEVYVEMGLTEEE